MHEHIGRLLQEVMKLNALGALLRVVRFGVDNMLSAEDVVHIENEKSVLVRGLWKHDSSVVREVYLCWSSS